VGGISRGILGRLFQRAAARVRLTAPGSGVLWRRGRRVARRRWLSGPDLKRELQTRAADPDLTRELNELTGHTLDEL
jgi:hypothetical protein